MIKKFKIYETSTRIEPQVNDYVIVKSESPNKRANNHINTHVGIVYENLYSNHVRDYKIKYEFLPFMNDIIMVYRYQIIHFSKSKDEMELILQTNKYNI